MCTEAFIPRSYHCLKIKKTSTRSEKSIYKVKRFAPEYTTARLIPADLSSPDASDCGLRRGQTSCVKLQISWSPLKSLHITFLWVIIVSFNGVGEQRVLLFQEEWPQQPHERRSLERPRACVCGSLAPLRLQETHGTGWEKQVNYGISK